MRTTLLSIPACLAASLTFAACGADAAGDTDADLPDAGTDIVEDSGIDTGSDAATTADSTFDDAADTRTEVDADTDAGPTAPTLQQVYTEVLSGCGGVLCHLDGQSQGDLNLDFDDTLFDRLLGPSSVDGLAIVEPGDPDNSYMYLKLTDAFRAAGGTGSRMPLGGGQLSSSKLDLLAAWIESL